VRRAKDIAYVQNSVRLRTYGLYSNSSANSLVASLVADKIDIEDMFSGGKGLLIYKDKPYNY